MEQFIDCKITAANQEEFLIQFKKLLESDEAKNQLGIVYIWKLQNPISRVIGQSPIVYIGQTKNSLRDRYFNTRSLDIEKQYFEKYYKFMIEEYGSLSIEIIPTSSPKYKEWEMLMEYNSKHKEYPPLNRSIPNKPNH